MNSPLTNKLMDLMFEDRILKFRKEEFKVNYQFFLCVDSEEQFTSMDLEEANMSQVTNQYRTKHDIPFPDEISYHRKAKGLSQQQMAELLGIRLKEYQDLEIDKVPTIELSQLIKESFDKVQNSENPKLSAIQKVDLSTGYKYPSIEKTQEIIHRLSLTDTKRNNLGALLMYIDLLCFKTHSFSITGSKYFVENDQIESSLISYIQTEDNEHDEVMTQPNSDLLSIKEKAVVEYVAKLSTEKIEKYISDVLEMQAPSSIIPYDISFKLDL